MDKLDKKAEDKAEAASYMTFSLTNLEGTQHTVETSSEGLQTGSVKFAGLADIEQQPAPSIRPVTDMQLCLDNWGLIRQWYDALLHHIPSLINQSDYDLYRMIAQHLRIFNYPLPAPRFAGAKPAIASLGSVGAELTEMQPERLQELLGSIPAAPLPAPPLNKERWGSNEPSESGAGWDTAEVNTAYGNVWQADVAKAPTAPWYNYEQQKPVTAPHVGCEVIVLEKPGLLVMQEARKFFNKVSRVVHCFKNTGDIQLAVVEHEDGTCCCFVLELIAPVDYDKPTFNKFYKDMTYALGFPPDNLQAEFLLKLYKAGFKAPEQSK